MVKNTKQLVRKIYHKSRALLRQAIGYPIIYNANNVDEDTFNRRALIVYLVKPFLLKEDSTKFLAHQNLKQCKRIAAILGEFGYVVDVADIKSTKIRSNKEYDLLISHNSELDIASINLKKDAIKTYLASGINHLVNNINVKKRYEDLYKRRGCKLKIRRLNDEKLNFVKNADFIFGFGNQFTMDAWSQNFKQEKYYFNNYGFDNTKYIGKDFNKARFNFLFFASVNQVGKGLDLLLEIFPKHQDLHLYICSNFKNEEDFCRCYHKELYETPNIHPIGWIKVNSPQYNELAEECAYTILPTCSDGQVGSVVQCMYSGLIPIVTKEAGIDTEDFGVIFENDNLEAIEKTILNLSYLPATWHAEHSRKTREVAIEKYSEKAFMNRWQQILKDIHK